MVLRRVVQGRRRQVAVYRTANFHDLVLTVLAIQNGTEADGFDESEDSCVLFLESQRIWQACLLLKARQPEHTEEESNGNCVAV